MGGSTSEKEDGNSYYDIFISGLKRVGYAVADTFTVGIFARKKVSGLERKVSELQENHNQEIVDLRDCHSKQMSGLKEAHSKEKGMLAKRAGMLEASNKRLGTDLSKTHIDLKESKAANERLETNLSKAHGELKESKAANERLENRLDSTYNELKKVKDSYEKAKKIIVANESLGAAMLELEEFHKKVGIIIPNAEENALNVLRRQRAFVREAYQEIEQTKKEKVIGNSYVKVAEKKAMIVLDEKNRVEAMSKAAITMLGKDITGRSVNDISNSLGIMLGYVAPTYEQEFNTAVASIGNAKEPRLNVDIERYDGMYIGAIVVVEPLRFWQKVITSSKPYILTASETFDDGKELTRMVNATVSINYGRKPIAIDLRRTTEVSDEVARRLGGLAQSIYFRNRMKVITDNGSVYKHLRRFDVPEKIIIGGLESGEAAGEVVPVPVKS